ncbi:MAG: TonB family protein [Acidobacteriia bacterium]|jgi:TonB family protein|nr:TonB family protein [Terriglobia bacterium]
MAFRALLFSKSTETNSAITTACESAGIRLEVCADIFSAIEKGTKQTFSCVIADWADQPEASFLLKRTRESASNGDTVAIAVVDHEPRPAEIRDNRLDFLIYRPISATEADAVLAKACEQMRPVRAEVTAEPSGEAGASNEGPGTVSVRGGLSEHIHQDQLANFWQGSTAQGIGDREIKRNIERAEEEPRQRGHAIGFRGACAAVLVLAAVFFVWRSAGAVEYLSRTPEGKLQVLRESVAALFHTNQKSAPPASSAAGYTPPDDAYFSRDAASSNAPTPALAVVATESSLPETRMALPKAPELPLPVPVFERQNPAPVHREHVAIPESMRNSAPMERPVVVVVNPALVPVSAPPPQPTIRQSNEPVPVSEETARALLVHTVNAVYPPEALAQKLHGPVVLQAVIGRDGTVEDLKLERGYFVLGRAAIAAVKQWRFQPYSPNGHATATQTLITINFSYPPG